MGNPNNQQKKSALPAQKSAEPKQAEQVDQAPQKFDDPSVEEPSQTKTTAPLPSEVPPEPEFEVTYLVNRHGRCTPIVKARADAMLAKEGSRYRRATPEEIDAYKKANPPQE
jgi:hypothetical protein